MDGFIVKSDEEEEADAGLPPQAALFAQQARELPPFARLCDFLGMLGSFCVSECALTNLAQSHMDGTVGLALIRASWDVRAPEAIPLPLRRIATRFYGSILQS